jgi:hypothetical protein
VSKRKSLAHIRELLKARGRETPSPQKVKEPSLDPLVALKDIKTLARAAQDCAEMDLVQKHFAMIVTIVDKALAGRTRGFDER